MKIEQLISPLDNRYNNKIIDYYSKANLVITRSGASVLGELINIKIPFISIPLPTSADNHQLKNAIYYKTYITQEMLKKGILANTNFYACVEHTQEEVDEYLSILNDLFRTVSKCELGEINIKDLLDGPVCETGFGRLN